MRNYPVPSTLRIYIIKRKVTFWYDVVYRSYHTNGKFEFEDFIISVIPELVELIRQNCPNLTHLSLSLTTPEIPVSVSDLLTSSVLLRHFSIYIYSSEFPFLTTEELLKFSRSFPKTLLYFGFYLAITSDILSFFLKECPASFRVLCI